MGCKGCLVLGVAGRPGRRGAPWGLAPFRRDR